MDNVTDKRFRKVNFFNGLFTEAEDWNAIEQYHIEKRKLHNRHLHTPGVVRGCLEDLKVTTDSVGTRLFILSGYAIDGDGMDLYMPYEYGGIDIVYPKNLPATVYVTIKYDEKKEDEDKRENIIYPDQKDYAFVREDPILEITEEMPDNDKEIELARIFIEESRKIKNPDNPNNPGPNEIDMTHVKRAGVNYVNFGILIKDLQIEVAPSKDTGPSDDDNSVLIERVELPDAHRFYQVSAYPESYEGAHILWRVESIFVQGAVEYWLFFENRTKTKKKVSVRYKVYRLC